jgi:hypothetical protein
MPSPGRGRHLHFSELKRRVCVEYVCSLLYGPNSMSPMPSWLPVALTIADFVVQRVDRVGPVSFEPPEKQPPERARTAVPSSTKKEAPSSSAAQSSETSPTSENDPPLGFQARGGNTDPTEAEDDDEDDEYRSQARAGGNTDPSSGNGGGGGGTDPDDDDDENELRCSFRSMRVKDRPTTYEV